MQLISEGKNLGKRIELVKKCAKKDAYIVCYNKNEAKRATEIAKRLELDINPVVIFNEREKIIFKTTETPFLISKKDFEKNKKKKK